MKKEIELIKNNKIDFNVWVKLYTKKIKKQIAKEIFADLEEWLFREGDVSSWDDIDEYWELKKKYGVEK